MVHPKKTPPPVPTNRSFNNLETWHTYSGGDTLTFHLNQPRIAPGFRAINTQSDLGRTP